ncbi:class I SAM-dependent methyltransferase [Amycolatopsis jiangsuensis]|uniref:SAM-dependent methyltransferase n=1 Tax=Amycolatopsis jiangsuensis TaxID=1181879 RepID=A0A840IPW1_9PSEU|nr:methyltransferase domain-containing protein [Amycolatopsis jiangsuensis]MBB4683495.1 SAM-dependent methyltransferase [Amycolatopsis jiangsuensis]
MSHDPDEAARVRAGQALAAGDPTGWFEPLYADVESGDAVLPWNRTEAAPELARWVAGRPGEGRSALVVGCGMGYDAELLAASGYTTSAFDVSPSAIKAVLNRFPDTAVSYRTADLLDPPPEYHHAFDLVLEYLTVQSMPRAVREEAITSVAGFVAPGGRLLLGSTAAEAVDLPDGPPWPLDRGEVESFARDGLVLDSLDRVRDGRFWWAELTRNG